MQNSFDNIKQFSDLATRKAELRLDIVRKETEIKYRFQGAVEMMNPVRIVNEFLDGITDKVKNITEIIALIISLFSGNRRSKTKTRK